MTCVGFSWHPSIRRPAFYLWLSQVPFGDDLCGPFCGTHTLRVFLLLF